mgnify:CR=1 FL=1
MTLEELNRTSPFHAGAENTAFAPYFDGTSYLNMLSTEQVPVGCVTFAPGCRNHWHIHRAARGGPQVKARHAAIRAEPPAVLFKQFAVNFTVMVHHAQPALDGKVIIAEHIGPLHAEKQNHLRCPHANAFQGT